MTDLITDDDGFTELVDPQVPRVDLVDLPANGATGWLLMKQGAQGLMDPDVIRDLIGKPEPVEKTTEEQVTMTGSPGAIARLIHEAAQRREAAEVAKAKYDAADRKKMAADGQAMKDGSYPIADKADLGNAIRAVGRGNGDHSAIRRHIIARAKSLGASSEIPDNWAADGSLKEVAKMVGGEPDEGIDGMDPTVVLAAPDEDAPGDPNDPGSPAWEAIDAATARKWTSILSRAKTALSVMSDREMLEAATADPDDADNALDLDDAACAIDYAISILAPFAVDEQGESDYGADEMDTVGKALTNFDPAALDTIESLGHVAKAGRTLSANNEQAIRDAVASLQKVLASLPAAPTPEESGRPVAKTANEEPDMPQPTTSDEATSESGQQAAMGAQEPEPKPVAGEPVTDMAKADGDKEMVAVYDQKGHLVGIVDPDKITRIAGAEPDDDTSGSGDDDTQTSDDGTAADTTDATPAAAPTDLTPAPPAEVGTPADAAPSDDDTVTKTEPTDDTPSDDVTKSSITELVKSLLDEHSATQTEEIAKQRDAVLELVGLVEALKGRIGTLEEQPAEPKVFTNGAVPPRAHLRGQDQGAAPIDTGRVREMKKALYTAPAAEQNRIAAEMQSEAIAKLQEIHQRRAQ